MDWTSKIEVYVGYIRSSHIHKEERAVQVMRLACFWCAACCLAMTWFTYFSNGRIN